jgi:hypothetical protein
MEHPYVAIVRTKVTNCTGYFNEIVKRSGVSKSWLVKFKAGQLPNPGIETLTAVDSACDIVLAQQAVPTIKRKATIEG